MGYAGHFMALSITEVENLNVGEQLTRVQNEISGVSGQAFCSLLSICK